MTLNEYQKLSTRTIDSNQTKLELLTNFALGLCGEAGEVSEPIKKYVFHGRNLDVSSVRKELGDCLFYLAGICTVLGLELGDVAQANIEKLQARYPEGFSVQASQNRGEE